MRGRGEKDKSVTARGDEGEGKMKKQAPEKANKGWVRYLRV